MSGGRSLGFTQDLGGGWADQVLAHTSMLHPLPDARARPRRGLHEPVSIASHGLLRAPPHDGDPVLVVGAGIIGLATVAAVKGLFPGCPVTVAGSPRRTRPPPPRRAARTTWCAETPAAATSRRSRELTAHASSAARRT